MPQKYYSTTEVARILRLSRIAVFQRIKSGRLKAEKVGRNYIISHENLSEALGQVIGEERREAIERAIEKALHEYGGTFKLLGKE